LGNSPECITYFLDNGVPVDVNASNEDGIKPLDLVTGRTDAAAEETIIELLKNNANSRHVDFFNFMLPLQTCIFKKNLLTAGHY
jgi:hypothetical protein